MQNNPTLDSGVKLSVDENAVPALIPRLSRSPHPYHRQNDQIHQSSLAAQRRSLRSRPDIAQNTSQILSAQYVTGYFDADSRKRRKIATSSSDSGTEADDERPSLLRGLPAPDTRPRKGLRVSQGQETDPGSSPFLTPSQLDERPGSLVAGSGLERRISATSQGVADTRIAHMHDKNTRRRRGELVRRLVEVVILATVGYISVKGSKQETSTGEYICEDCETSVLSYTLQKYGFILCLSSGSISPLCFVFSGIDGQRITMAIGFTPTSRCR